MWWGETLPAMWRRRRPIPGGFHTPRGPSTPASSGAGRLVEEGVQGGELQHAFEAAGGRHCTAQPADVFTLFTFPSPPLPAAAAPTACSPPATTPSTSPRWTPLARSLAQPATSAGWRWYPPEAAAAHRTTRPAPAPWPCKTTFRWGEGRPGRMALAAAWQCC